MGVAELFLIAVGLSMDAFAASVCKGLECRRFSLKRAALIGVFFGGFQALMPLIGWFVGSRFEKYITDFDHWVAFVLLAFIGGKMIWEVCFGKDEEKSGSGELKLRELLVLSVATSIDALAVGITFALLPDISIWYSIALIGLTTFIFSFTGFGIGSRFGVRYKSGAEIAGGVILILIGLKILLEHLGVISF